MKAFVRYRYGGPETLQLEELEKPGPKDGQILVRVMANSPNPVDWHIIRGVPRIARLAFGWFRPRHRIVGADFAGVVEAIGKNVNHFRVGDRVFGSAWQEGSFAEYVCTSATRCAKMPEGCSFAEMASLPVAGVTAYQALFSIGELQKGESVLINAATGGVGHFAVQMAKAMGAKVSAVCSAKNADFARSLGADAVIAYDQEDIHQHAGRYDLIVDAYGNLNFKDLQRMGQRAVIVGFTSLGQMLSVQFFKLFGKIPVRVFTADIRTEDLEAVASLVQSKQVSVHISKTFTWQEIPQAVAFIEAMHTRGKVVMQWAGDPA